MDYMPYLGKIGFDNQRYIEEQAKAIIERAEKFHKLYLEFGGKLFFDFHAAAVLPGYHYNAKLSVLKKLAKVKKVGFLVVVSAKHLLEKRFGHLGITYRDFTLGMISLIRKNGFPIEGVIINMFENEPDARDFASLLKAQGYKVYYRTPIPSYPSDLDVIISKDGFGKPPFVETSSEVIVVTAPGPGAGKMTMAMMCVYQDFLRGIESGYAKFETFPVWDLPLEHPINIAYEAATADIGDYNIVDPYHLKYYGIPAVNYNRDVKNFEVLKALINMITSETNYMRRYHSPTDMGINEVSSAIIDESLCKKAALQEIARRYFRYKLELLMGKTNADTIKRIDKLLKKYDIDIDIIRPIVAIARKEKERSEKDIKIGAAMLLPDGSIVRAHNTSSFHAEAAVILKALKHFAGIPEEEDIIKESSLKKIKRLKKSLGGKATLNVQEMLIALALSAQSSRKARKAFSQMANIYSSELHTTHILSYEDEKTLRRLGINVTSDGEIDIENLIHI